MKPSASAGGMGGQDILIAKYNSAGTLAWQRSLGTSAADSGISISFNAAGNPVILGYGTATGNAIVATYDANGNLLWQVQLPANFYPRDITADTVRIPTIPAIDSDRNQPPVPNEASRGFR